MSTQEAPTFRFGTLRVAYKGKGEDVLRVVVEGAGKHGPVLRVVSIVHDCGAIRTARVGELLRPDLRTTGLTFEEDHES